MRGNMASSGTFVSAVHTFSSNSCKTVKERRRKLSSLKFFQCTRMLTTLTNLFLWVWFSRKSETRKKSYDIPEAIQSYKRKATMKGPSLVNK